MANKTSGPAGQSAQSSNGSRAAAAEHLFSPDDELNKEVMAREERKTETHGGVEGGWVEDLSPEQQQSAADIVESLYPTILKVVQEKGADKATDFEVSTRVLYDKLKSGDAINDPKEQAQIYTFIQNLKVEMGNPDFADRLRADLIAEVNRPKEEGEEAPAFETIDDLLKAQSDLEKDVFFNLTGYKPEDTWQYDDLYKGKRVWEGVYREVRVRTSKKYRAAEMDRYRTEMLEGNVGEFKPQEVINNIAEQAFLQSQEDALRYLNNTVKNQMLRRNAGWLPDEPRFHKRLDMWIADAEKATSLVELEDALAGVQEMHENEGGALGARAVAKKFEALKPRRKAEAIALESAMADEYDDLARGIMKRELPRTEEGLKATIADYEKRISRKGTSKTEKENLERKRDLAREALKLLDESTGEMDKFLRKESTIKVSDFTDRLPDKIGDEFADWLGEEYGVGKYESKTHGSEAKYREKIETEMKKSNKFAAMGKFFRWLGYGI